jgi:hypothetical protein
MIDIEAGGGHKVAIHFDVLLGHGKDRELA